MNDAAGLAQELLAKDGKPAFVSFSTVARQLVKESELQGRYVARDVDMVTLRQIGSTDSVMFKVEDWLKQNKIDVAQGRLPQTHMEAYAESYRRWKLGQEIPVEGTPIKTWPAITPAQVETLLRIGVRTVEDLSRLSDEGLSKVGMGAIDLKNKAKAWIAAGNDKGKLAQDMTILQRENANMKSTIDRLTEQIEELRRLTPVRPTDASTSVVTREAITMDDVMDEPEPVRGRKR